RRIGVLDQRGRVGAVFGIEADADARADEELAALDVERVTDCLENLLCDERGVFGSRQHRNEERELVAAEARNGVAFADAGCDTRGDGLQQLIADVVAERVGDYLEAIEVEEQ